MTLIILLVLGGMVATYNPPQMTTERVTELIPVGDVESLNAWIYKNIRYAKDVDSDDQWKNAWQTITEGEGDCEDRAAVGIAVISKWDGWKAQMVVISRKTITGRRVRHAVCGYESPDGRRGIIDGKVIESKDWGGVFEQTYYDEAEFTDNRGKRLNKAGWVR